MKVVTVVKLLNGKYQVTESFDGTRGKVYNSLDDVYQSYPVNEGVDPVQVKVMDTING